METMRWVVWVVLAVIFIMMIAHLLHFLNQDSDEVWDEDPLDIDYESESRELKKDLDLLDEDDRKVLNLPPLFFLNDIQPVTLTEVRPEDNGK